ncbi:MAG: alpha/beta fold hydrolase [Oligoflexus sp.]
MIFKRCANVIQRWRKLGLALALFASHPLLAIPEDELELRENELAAFYKQGTSGYFIGVNQVPTYYHSFIHPEEKLKLVILTGRTESTEKYDELAYDLYQRSYSVYLFDWPGHGKSGRYLEDTHKCHITDYQDYLHALEQFMDQMVAPQGQEQLVPIAAFAHSMGANVLSLYTIKHPQKFDRLILSSPMLDIPTPINQKALWYFLRFAEWIGFGDAYVYTHGPYDPNEENHVTSSVARYQRQIRWRVANPQKNLGGATIAWARASLEATWEMRSHAEQMTTPILLLQAGKDIVVKVDGQDYVCSQAADCQKVYFADAKHEILQESDSIRDRALEAILEFLEPVQGSPLP